MVSYQIPFVLMVDIGPIHTLLGLQPSLKLAYRILKATINIKVDGAFQHLVILLVTLVVYMVSVKRFYASK